MIKQTLALSGILMCCCTHASAEVLSADPAELAMQSDSSSPEIQTIENDEYVSLDIEAGSAAEQLAGDADGAAPTNTPPRPRAKVTVVTVAADKNLVKHEVDPAENVEVMICSRERPPTGSRLKRKRCRTVQQMKKEAEFNKIRYQKSSNQFERTQPRIFRSPGGN